MDTTRVSFRLPDDLVEKADVGAAVSRKNRTEIVKEALREHLAEMEDDDEFREAVVELYPDDRIGFDVLKEFVGRRDAESVRASRTLLDRGEELADELADLWRRETDDRRGHERSVLLATVDLLDAFLAECDVHTAETVVEELEDTAAYDDDDHGTAAGTVLGHVPDQITVHRTDDGEFDSSRVDPGEGSCALLTRSVETRYLITDDLRALPELQTVADAKTAILPIVLKALVERDVLEQDEATAKRE